MFLLNQKTIQCTKCEMVLNKSALSFFPGGNQPKEHSAGLQALSWQSVLRPVRSVSQVELGVWPGTDAVWSHWCKSTDFIQKQAFGIQTLLYFYDHMIVVKLRISWK